MTKSASQKLEGVHAEAINSINLRLISHNIRMAAKPSERSTNEEAWSVRCPYICSELVFNSVLPETFIGLQEVLFEQLNGITSGLKDDKIHGEWAHIGVGREDGKQAGEHEPIFYRSNVWKLLSSRYVWISETPEVPSKGWDAACTRVMTIGEFEHRKTGQKIVVMNTHLDHEGIKARNEGAKLVLKIIDEYKSTAKAVFLMGDFNSEPDDGAYQTVTSPSSSMKDFIEEVVEKKRYGDELTYSGFAGEEKPKRIDFIFSRKADKVKVGTYAVLSNRFEDGVFLSDHRAVVTDVQVQL